MYFFTFSWVPLKVQVVCHNSGKIREKRGVCKNYLEVDPDRWEYMAFVSG